MPHRRLRTLWKRLFAFLPASMMAVMTPMVVIAMVMVPMPAREVMPRAPVAIRVGVRTVVVTRIDARSVIDPRFHIDAFLPIDRYRFVVATLDDALAFHHARLGSVVVGFTLSILGTVEVGRTGWSGDAE